MARYIRIEDQKFRTLNKANHKANGELCKHLAVKHQKTNVPCSTDGGAEEAGEAGEVQLPEVVPL